MLSYRQGNKTIKCSGTREPGPLLTVYLLNEDTLDGATAGVNRFRTQQFHENLLILYANIGDEPVPLKIG